MTALRPGSSNQGVVLDLPFTGRWLVQNSPARRVPSHGTDLFGERFAIDFVGVNERRRTSEFPSWSTAFGVEPPDRFVSFGRPILAPCEGVVTDTHDGEADHEARRSPLALLPYALSQGQRVRRGIPAIAGNFVILEMPERIGFVALVHLKRDSLRVEPGQQVRTGQHLAECGNSGNSTQPHLHLQAMDSRDLSRARGIPLAFREYREQLTRTSEFADRAMDVPAEGAVVEP
jgi:hypothetical protein